MYATPNDPNVEMSQVLNLVASSGDSVTSFAVSKVGDSIPALLL